MVDVAEQAFRTNNFQLSADIYERSIRENGPKLELYLGLADSFARAGHFQKAFEAYSHCFRYGKVSPNKLKHLVTGLVETVKQEKVDVVMKKRCMFTCWLCRGLLSDPVTIPCGHTYCRKCLSKEDTKSCRLCGVVNVNLKLPCIKSNVLLTHLIRKWFTVECQANELKSEGNLCFEKRDLTHAIKFYSEAIILVPNDHLLLSNRSYAYALQDEPDEALSDADRVVELRPDWPKGYFRRGNALYQLQRYEEAVVAFLQCLALDQTVSSAKDELAKALHKILCHLPPDDPKLAQRQQHQSPSFFQQLITSNFSTSQLFHGVTVNTILHLKSIISNTIDAASNFKTSPAPDRRLSVGHCPDETEEGDGEDDKPNIRIPRCQSAPTLGRCSPVFEQQACEKASLSNLQDICRKRSRHVSETSPQSPTHSPKGKYPKGEASTTAFSWDSIESKLIPAELKNAEDFECGLCYRLFYKPVTTPCGHMFCCQCLDRCLDHSSSCPLCKFSLVEYLAERRQAVTDSVQMILETHFNKETEEREKAHEEEMLAFARMGSDDQHEIPVFVCTLSYPTVPCPLHIFEPRYRLMIRQCMESGIRQFGMCVALGEDDNQYSDFGTMLEIRDVQFFPDGRSIVDTIGSRRFKVLERGHRDGYNTAKVEFLRDEKVEGSELADLYKLEEEIYTLSQIWFEKLPSTRKERITQHFGSLPSRDSDPQASPNGPSWHWWVIAILPLDPRIQLAFLSMAAYKGRLQSMKRVLSYLQKKSAS